MSSASATIDRSGEGVVVGLTGRVLIEAVSALQGQLRDIGGPGEVVFDLNGVEALDTAGAWMIVDTMQRLERENVAARVAGASEMQTQLIGTVRRSLPKEAAPVVREGGFVVWLEGCGRNTAAAVGVLLELLSFLGEVIARLGAALIRPRRLRLTSLVHHMQEVGLNAVPSCR